MLEADTTIAGLWPKFGNFGEAPQPLQPKQTTIPLWRNK
jgi:hypothetical protein